MLKRVVFFIQPKSIRGARWQFLFKRVVVLRQIFRMGRGDERERFTLISLFGSEWLVGLFNYLTPDFIMVYIAEMKVLH